MRRLAGMDLAGALRDSRERLLSRVADLTDSQWNVPQQSGINPPAWELGHVAWFAEHWILKAPSDPVFDSSRLPHAERWRVPLPDREQVFDKLRRQLEACLEALPAGDDDEALYFHRLVLFHEDMHGEALAWMRATLAYPACDDALPALEGGREPVCIDACQAQLGAPAGEGGFRFDNEQPGHRVALAAFEIDAEPVSAGEYLRFVEAGGPAPERWRHGPEGWQQRWFDRWLPLDARQPVVHLNAFEAEAYARWAGRRLPSAAEWECAAPHIGWGAVWEWTASPFAPYPGFEPGPYAEYSAPWFGDHRELRGASFVTPARLHHPSFRNFFLPHRRDVFAGFRTAVTL